MMHRMIGRSLIVGLTLAAFGFDAMAQYSATNRRAAAKQAQQDPQQEQDETQQPAQTDAFGLPEAKFSIDRRPVLMLRIWNGSYEGGNPLGLSARLRGDDAGTRIAHELDALYAQGWRRIMLGTPTGGPRGFMLDRTFGEFPLRTRAWRENMSEQLGRWALEHPDVTLGIYMGLKFRNNTLPVERDFARYLGPWLDMGFTEFAFDASAMPDTREAFFNVSRWLNERGARAVMEAYGRDRGGLDYNLIGSVPALALKRFVDKQEQGKLAFDARTTEMWIGLGRGEDIVADEVRKYHQRGFVILVYHTSMEHRARALEVLGLLAENAPANDASQDAEFDASGNPARVVTTRRPLR